MSRDVVRSSGSQSGAKSEGLEGDTCDLLTGGEMEVHGLLPWSSNYTFLVSVRRADHAVLAVYKPRRGETPLWDFPQGTLCLREYAAYVVSEALGWSFVPPTVLRSGVHGFGSVQLFVEADQEQHYFTFRDQHTDQLQRIALFDVVVNNADRKSGHCLLGPDGHIWAVDHGVTFHAEPKLRTVIWDYAGQPIPRLLLADLSRFRGLISDGGPVVGALAQVLSSRELRALRRRVDELLRAGEFPEPDPHRRAVPWPLV
jgi:uncharacterized repeat protein (TIGR03843 family)